ncbi:hypothetical protein ACLOJK_034968, partial [Asimina triloba]
KPLHCLCCVTASPLSFCSSVDADANADHLLLPSGQGKKSTLCPLHFVVHKQPSSTSVGFFLGFLLDMTEDNNVNANVDDVNVNVAARNVDVEDVDEKNRCRLFLPTSQSESPSVISPFLLPRSESPQRRSSFLIPFLSVRPSISVPNSLSLSKPHSPSPSIDLLAYSPSAIEASLFLLAVEPPTSSSPFIASAPPLLSRLPPSKSPTPSSLLKHPSPSSPSVTLRLLAPPFSLASEPPHRPSSVACRRRSLPLLPRHQSIPLPPLPLHPPLHPLAPPLSLASENHFFRREFSAAPMEASLKITVEKGPRKGETLEAHPKSSSSIRIGRVIRGNSLAIKDSGISQKHLNIAFTDGKWTVTDLDTSNGTFLNDVQLKALSPSALADGDVIKIGESTSIAVSIKGTSDHWPEQLEFKPGRNRSRPGRPRKVRSDSEECLPAQESNGTFLNNAQLKALTPSALTDGNVIKIGDSTSIAVSIKGMSDHGLEQLEIKPGRNRRRPGRPRKVRSDSEECLPAQEIAETTSFNAENAVAAEEGSAFPKELERITLGEWFDRMEIYLPKQINDAAEEIIQSLRQRHKQFVDFIEQQSVGKGRHKFISDYGLDEDEIFFPLNFWVIAADHGVDYSLWIGVRRIPVKRLSTSGKLPVCLTATPNPMSDQRGGSLRGPEGEGTAGHSGFEPHASHPAAEKFLVVSENLSLQQEAAAAQIKMSVVGFDFGNESCVVAVARQRGIDVILNDELKRETSAIRFIGTAGAASSVMNLKNAISQIKWLIGWRFSDPELQWEIQSMPFKVVEGPDGYPLAQAQYLGETRTFTPMQLFGMVLSDLKTIAEKNLNAAVVDCCIGIPVYFTDLQRRAVLDAATIAGLHPLRLIHETTATALVYGIYKTDLPENDQLNVAFVDVGHASMQVCIAGFKKGQPKVLVHSYDRWLGGWDFDEVLFRHFAAKFKEEYKMDVYQNACACHRLRTACEQLKKVLSANPEAPLNIECLMDEKDVRGFIKREEFEKICVPILELVKSPLEKALTEAGLGVENIHSVEVVGSGSRVPAIIKMITVFFGKEPRRTMNASSAPDSQNGAAEQQQNTSTKGERSKLKVKVHLNLHGIVSVESAMLLEEEEIEVPVLAAKESNKEAIKMETDAATNDAAPEGTSENDVNIQDARTASDTPGTGVENGVPESGDKPVQMETDNKAEVTKKKVKKTNIPVVELVNGGMAPADVQKAVEEFEMALQDRVMEETKDKKNAVEAYVYDMRNKLYDKYQEFVTESGREAFSAKLQETEDWLYEDGEDETKGVYTAKLKELMKVGDPIEERYKEYTECGSVMYQLVYCLNSYREAAMLQDPKFDHIDIAEKQKVIHECAEAEAWFREKSLQQSTLPKHATPAFLTADVRRKADALDRFCRPMMTKPKPAPPKPQTQPEASPQTPESQLEAGSNSSETASGAGGNNGEETPAAAAEPMETEKREAEDRMPHDGC